jgi:hypothetical protein
MLQPRNCTFRYARKLHQKQYNGESQQLIDAENAYLSDYERFLEKLSAINVAKNKQPQPILARYECNVIQCGKNQRCIMPASPAWGGAIEPHQLLPAYVHFINILTPSSPLLDIEYLGIHRFFACATKNRRVTRRDQHV